MDASTSRPLRLVTSSAEERHEMAEKKARKRQLQQHIGCTGCLAILAVWAILFGLALLLAYQLFLWLRY